MVFYEIYASVIIPFRHKDNKSKQVQGGDIINKEQVIAILSRNIDNLHGFHVQALYLFGSVVRGDEKKTSDVDLLVEFEPDARVGLFEFSRLQRMLSELLGCDVDLATPDMRAMRNFIVHEYFGVSDKILWDTVQLDLPSLEPLMKEMHEKCSES